MRTFRSLPQGGSSRLAPLRLLPVLFALVVAVGCGGTDPASKPASAAPPATGSTPQAAGTADACSLLTAAEIGEAVGNPVGPGQQSAGPEVCDWDPEDPREITVLLMARLKGSTRETVLCEDVRKAAAEGKGLAGIGEAARWVFSPVPFNSGDLEVCGAKGYLSLTVTGKGEETKLRAAAMALARKALDRL